MSAGLAVLITGRNAIVRGDHNRLLSYRIRKQAKRHGVSYSFLFMRASGRQLTEIASLIDQGIVRPVVDRVFPFASTKEAMAYVEAGRAKGKVVVSLT